MSESTWTAVRYLLDELDPAEARAFESRLDEDQVARESLATAVELVGALRIALPAARPRIRRRRAPVVAGVLMALAACLACAILPRMLVPADPAAGAEVALAWSAYRGEADVEPDDNPAAPADVAPADLDDADVEGAVPAWLLEVVSLPAEDADRAEVGQGR